MSGNNASSADNQQERLETSSWIVGFVDGEGCFSASIFRNRTTSLGWQVFPEFVITQGESSITALKKVRNYFQCGSVIVNKRYDNHTENLYRYCVRSVEELDGTIIPFFKRHPLQTAKKEDFAIFCDIVQKMKAKQHLSVDGMAEIAKQIEKMNRQKASNFLESLETIRQDSDSSE